MKKYEGLFIYASTLSDEDLDKAVERTVSDIKRLEGEVDTTEKLGRRTFARTMKKRDEGTYVKIVFRMTPSNLDALKHRFSLNEDIFRAQILVAEARRPASDDGQAPAAESPAEAGSGTAQTGEKEVADG